MTSQVATYFPQRASVRVPNRSGDARTTMHNVVTMELGAPAALNNQGILAAQSMTSAGNTSTFAAAYIPQTRMGIWGRALRYVASGASTGTVTVTGRDYMNQKVVEVITLNGTTPVLGLKAFKYIDNIAWTSTSGVTLDVGWRDCFGLMMKSFAMVNEVKNQAPAANAGTFVAGLATATAATSGNADVRGTYTPVTVIPDGTNTFVIVVQVDKSNLDGNAQYAG